MSTIVAYKKFTGQLGNHLFQKNFVLQSSNELNFGYFHRKSYSELIVQSDNKKIDLIDCFRTKRILFFSAEEIQNMGFVDWINELRKFPLRTIFVIENELMGDLFFESCLVDPKILMPLNITEYEKRSWNYPAGIHFRGKDFQKWNPAAILSIEYYMNAIDLLQQYGINIEDIFFSTDDWNHPISLKIISRLNYVRKISSVREDFIKFTRCNYIVSSPSTFIFWASIFSNGSFVIHSEKWIRHNMDRNVKFWIDLMANKKSFYNLHSLV